MKAVAAGNEVTLDFPLPSVEPVADARTVAVEVVQGHILRLVLREKAVGGASIHQVAGDLGLPVDHHRLAGESAKVDAVAHAIDTELRPVVDQALAMHALAGTGFVDQVDPHLFDHARTNAAQDIVRRLPFEDDIVDAVPMQQLAKQQARRTGADDHNLGAHGSGEFFLVDPRGLARRLLGAVPFLKHRRGDVSQMSHLLRRRGHGG